MPQVLTFGHTQGGNRKLWVERFKQLGPIARDHGVTIVVKQHGGETGTGAACAAIIREVGDEGIKVNYDAGNVMDYLDVDPIPDIRACADEVRSFCIKDHRNFPKDEDCGPGFGEIDHYRLLQPVAFTGRTCRSAARTSPPRSSRPDRSRGNRCAGPPGPGVPGSRDARLAATIRLKNQPPIERGSDIRRWPLGGLFFRSARSVRFVPLTRSAFLTRRQRLIMGLMFGWG